MNPSRSQHGAAMVVGLAFAVLLISLLFYVLGLAEAVLYRERVLDAADAAAFSAAVVNARGMNLIALINMTMAAILAILVGLRLAVTIGTAGIVLCGVLAWPTWGASLAGVPPLTQATKQISDVADKAKKPIRQALNVLHTAGKAISYVVPIGSNLGVIDQTVAHYGGIGVAIPSRLTLPVEDDDFSVLCEHAGRYASDVAMFPLSPILASSVRDRMGDVTGKVVAAGSSWFCDGQGKPPDFNDDADSRLEELPRFPSQTACESLARREAVDQAELERVCHRAAVERLASAPDRSGRARDGEPLCPTNCQRSQDARCPPKSMADCEPDEAQRLETARANLGSPGEESAYEQRARLARSQCKPASAGGRSDLQAFWWLEQTRTRHYAYDVAARRWLEETNAFEQGESQFVQRKDNDATHPCGEDGAVGEGYSLTEGEPVCRSQGKCVSTGSSDPCSREPPTRGRAPRFREQTREVVAILRCAYEREIEKVETPAMDITKDMGEEDDGKGGKKKNEPPKPFRLERDVYLGGSDFQLRTVVVSRVPNSFEDVVDMASWGKQSEGFSDQLLQVVTLLGGIGFSQGEYYFDFARVDDSLDDETDEGDRTEWMWHMGWRARLRPFRFRHGVADAERAEKGAQGKKPDFQVPGADKLKVNELDCGSLGDRCADVQGTMAAQDEVGDGR